MSQSLNRKNATTLTIRLGADSRAKSKKGNVSMVYAGQGSFGRAMKELNAYIQDFVVQYTLSEVELVLGEILFLCGEYMAEIIKAEMVEYGTPSSSVHVVTGSLMEAIKQQVPTGPTRFKHMIRGRIHVHVDPREQRRERSPVMQGGSPPITPIDSGESVASYGQDRMKAMTDMGRIQSDVQKAILRIMKSGRPTKWLNSPGMALLRGRVNQLRANNVRKITDSALARILRAKG